MKRVVVGAAGVILWGDAAIISQHPTAFHWFMVVFFAAAVVAVINGAAKPGRQAEDSLRWEQIAKDEDKLKKRRNGTKTI